MHAIKVIFKKELKDILRDTRALLTVSVVSILAGPILLIMIANMLASFESRAERRIVVVYGAEHAPSLVNHLARETAQIEPAPADYETALLDGRLQDPVLVIPPDFEQQWQQGEPQALTLVTNSSNARANAGVNRVKKWIGSLAGDRARIQLALQGVSQNALDYIAIEDMDLANAKAESAKAFGMLPYFFVLAALYGVWSSALDTTVGERERGTLEPLLVLPHATSTLLLGKWLAVATVGFVISGLAILSFLPAQAVIHSDTLRSMLAFGWYEAGICLLLVLPLCAVFAALMMAIGAISQNMRQAQANATAVLLVTAFLPMMSQVSASGGAGWQTYIPVMLQHHYILEMLKGEPIAALVISLNILITVLLVFALLKLATRYIKQAQ